MEHLENDMDDLFRKAGDQYPLKITGSDWDGVLGNLKNVAGNEQNAIAEATVVKNKRKRWLLLLLLIPIALGSVYIFSDSKIGNGHLTNKSIADSIKTELNTASHNRNSSPGASIPSDAVKQNSLKDAGTGSGNYTSSHPLRSQKNNVSHSDRKKVSGDMNDSFNSDDLFLDQALDDAFSAKIKPVSFSIENRNRDVVITSGAIPLSASSTNELKPGENAESKKKNEKPVSKKGFYVGLVAGPDLSTVKFQSVKQPGFSMGLLIGYRFNSRISLETGLLWDKKYYYSKGEYFDKSKTTIPNYANISNLEGYCNMFEIPIAIKYDFAASKKHNFFAKGGLTSYLMKKEVYDINAEVYGNPRYYPAVSYPNSTKTILSIVQLSAGYELSVGAKTQVRIEPYIKIPLGGVGIGNMPISSAGFYLGITHSFK